MLVCASLHHLARETAGAARTRSSLRPLYYEGGTNRPNLARNRQRECGIMSCRHCEERSDEAIHSFLSSLDGLLRGACHRAALRADPLARNDDERAADPCSDVQNPSTMPRLQMTKDPPCPPK